MDKVDQLIRQHNMIKDAVKEAQKVMGIVKTKGNETDYLDLVHKLEKVKYMLLEHGEEEEDELVPVLKKMYHGQEEMAHYVKDEHVLLEQEINVLIRHVKEHIESKKEKLDSDIYAKMNKFLHQTVTHMVEEEVSLFPMLRMMFPRE